MTPQVTGDTLRLVFDRWTAAEYELFLRTKALPEHEILYDEISDSYTIETPTRFAGILGFDIGRQLGGWLPFPYFLFDYQCHFVRLALEARRYALWFDTGLGKTLCELEFARQVQASTCGRVLMVYPLNLIAQVLGEATRFYGADFAAAVVILRTREEMIAWCKGGSPGIAIVNPEKFIPRRADAEVIPEISYLAGVVLDESSLLKTGGGTIKWALIKSCRGVEYKLSCTATPAPNDPIEYASQASWLEKIRDEGEVIWTYFVRDGDGEWRVKDHALAAFYRFLAGWSCYVRSPKRYGFADNLKDLPDYERIVHWIPVTPEQLRAAAAIATAGADQQALVASDRMGIVERARLGTLSSGFLYEEGRVQHVPSRKVAAIAELVRRDVSAGLQVLVWTHYDETAAMIERELATAAFTVETLTGSTPAAARAPMIERYIEGATQVLITRPKVLGFGTNLQNCGSMVFADLNDSYEQLYQAIRRAYRYGQTRAVRVHYPIVRELQGVVWQNLETKAAQFANDVDKMEMLYVEAMKGVTT